MKTIGIIGAMEEEVAYLKEKAEIIAKKNIAGLEFCTSKLYGKTVIIVRCGIGKVNAAICTQILIDLFGVDYIINTGVAGALDNVLNIGDIVISKDVVQHDFDTSLTGDVLGKIPGFETVHLDADEYLCNLAFTASEKALTKNKAYIGRIATGDQFIAGKEVKGRIQKNFKGICAEMEGGAIGHVATLNNIPFVIIRSISDKADESASIIFYEFVKIAAVNSSKIVETMLENMEA